MKYIETKDGPVCPNCYHPAPERRCDCRLSACSASLYRDGDNQECIDVEADEIEIYKSGSSASTCSLIALAETWERIAGAWLQVARDRNDDAPDLAGRARARAAIYLDCAEDLKANA